jgi:WD40 repeat protein
LATCKDRKIYVWDIVARTLKCSFVDSTNFGLHAVFHPTGALVASNGWESRLRLWDSVLGRTVLSLTSSSRDPHFSRDGRIVVSREDELATYQVDPALEYRTLAHAFGAPTSYDSASIRRDNRVLAVGSDRGAVLWDLARGTELAFLPIGKARHVMFEPSGDLITSGSIGVWRWPIQLEPDWSAFRMGPPLRLRSFPPGECAIAGDRSGEVVALANGDWTHVVTAERTFRLGPLDDCRHVAVSPDGEWLATGNHGTTGAQVWRIRDGERVADLPVGGLVRVAFSPGGKWLMTSPSPCRLWSVGAWIEQRRISGEGRCFSPDGRLLVVMDADKGLRLVEANSGRMVARFESPDSCNATWATFSPDGSRLVVTTNDGPAVHVWDLRAIRKRLAAMGLDWDAPTYPDDDPAAPSAPVFARMQIDDFAHAAAEAAAMAHRGRWEEAATAYGWALPDGSPVAPAAWFEQAILRLAVGDSAGYRWSCRRLLELVRSHSEPVWLEFAAHACTLAPHGPAEEAQALLLAEQRARAIHTPWSEHVFGLALYRAGRFAEADARLRGSLSRDPGWDFTVLDWLVLAMAQERLGRPDEARRWLGRAESWVAVRLSGRPGGADRAVPDNWDFRAGILLHLLLREARAVVREGLHELPENVFAPG